MYCSVTGVTFGDIRETVTWRNGEWEAPETLPDNIKWALAEGEPVKLTPTGPSVPADSPQAAYVLALRAFERVERVETDIPRPMFESRPDVVY